MKLPVDPAKTGSHPFLRETIQCIAMSAASAALLWAPLAQATITVDFECTIPASSAFDCNLLRQRFFKERSLSFIAMPGSEKKDHETPLKVTVGRLPVLNGHDYEIVVTEKNKPNGSVLKFHSFISDGANPISAIQEINTILHKGVLAFAKAVDEAVPSKDGSASMMYQDPADRKQHNPKPKSPSSEGRWVITPSVSGNLSAYSNVPTSIYASGGSSFNYSGDRNRYVASVNGTYNRSGVPVTLANADQKLIGVNTYSANATVGVVAGIDKKNHFNYGAALSAQTAPLNNVDMNVSAGIGVEYNWRPILDKDSNGFAVGCTISPSYFNFSRMNILEKQQFLAIMQSCAVTGSILIDKQRGSTISGTIGENWIVNAPDFFGASVDLSGTFRITERLTLSPTLSFSWKTKAITTASPKAAPSLKGLTPEQIAEETLKFQNQSASSSSLGVLGMLSVGYTFGDGVNRSAQDQRGRAIR